MTDEIGDITYKCSKPALSFDKLEKKIVELFNKENKTTHQSVSEINKQIGWSAAKYISEEEEAND